MFSQTQPAQKPPATAQIIQFPTGARLSADPERVAAILLAVEETPLFAPRVYAVRCIDGVHRVAAVFGERPYLISSVEARLVGDALWADPEIAGNGDLARRFREAALAADLGQTQDHRA